MKRLLLLLAACGNDPCADHAGTCVAVRVESPTVAAIDQLELDLLYGGTHGTTTSQPSGGGTHDLPIVVAIDLALDADAHVGVVAAGKLSGTVLGTGAAAAQLAPGEHAELNITLVAPDTCVAGTLYCGGDKLAGDAQTLYKCNGGGVPLARGRCLTNCDVIPNFKDTCHGAGGCIDGGDYCGGDKLDGDPQTLYTCTAGSGTNPRECPNDCVVRAGSDDICR